MKNKSGFLENLLAKDGTWGILSSVLAILSGLIVGFIILLVTNPANAVNGFLSILLGGFNSMRDVGQVLYSATPIILTGLSVCFAYKTGLFNIGASGQFIVGAYVAVFVGVKFTFIPGPFLFIICVLAAAVAGALWGVVPGLLNATRNVNVVISCIMMNYIGMHVVNLLVVETIFDSLKNQTLPVAEGANAPKMGLDLIFRAGNSVSSVNSGIFIAIITGVIVYIVIDKTKFGYELKACGHNRDAARYVGINEKRSIVYSMAIAGALAGIGGACLYLAGSGKAIEVVDVLAPEGFQGIPVALLGMNNPIGAIFAGVFIAYLSQGGFNMQIYGFAPQVIEIITSVIIYFSAFALILREILQTIIKKRKAKAEKEQSGTKAVETEQIKKTDDEGEGGDKA